MMVAIEDAGYLIHPVIGWAFGQGFPKSTRIDTQIDAAAGAVREFVGYKAIAYPDSDTWGTPNKNTMDRAFSSPNPMDRDKNRRQAQQDRLKVYAPATDLARAWAGHRYGLQALKPALEFIVVFQKPYQGRPVDLMVATGAGALNIDEARIAASGRPAVVGHDGSVVNTLYQGGFGGSHYAGTTDQGRWPANLLLSHSWDCVPPACVPGCAVAALGAQSGESSSNGQPRLNRTTTIGGNGIYQGGIGMPTAEHDDSGTAARYFFQADYAAERLEAADPLFYCAKSSTAEREAGLSGEKVQRRSVEYGSMQKRQCRICGTRAAEAGAGGRWPNCDHNDWEWVDQLDEGTKGGNRANIHPTCKPIALARHLATLLLAPGALCPAAPVHPLCRRGIRVHRRDAGRLGSR